LAREPEVLGENLPKYHFVNHKSHTTWPGIEPGKLIVSQLVKEYLEFYGD
jgi:hypothetical protein